MLQSIDSFEGFSVKASPFPNRNSAHVAFSLRERKMNSFENTKATLCIGNINNNQVKHIGVLETQPKPTIQ